MTEQIEAIAKRLVVRQKRDGRSVYDPNAKAELLRLARQPGVSVAKIARACGMNANVLSNWMRQAERGQDNRAEAGGEVIDMAAPAFVAVQVESLAQAQAPSPRWELQLRLPNGVSVDVRGHEVDGALRLIEALGRMRCSASTKD
jgi:transposase